jgi:tetratricopeptide (TPR) repeat protein
MRRGASPRRLAAAAVLSVTAAALVIAAWRYSRAEPVVVESPWQFAPGFYVRAPAADEETLLVWDGAAHDPWLHFHNGRAYYLRKEYDSAYREFSAALGDDPSLALAYWYRGMIQRHWKNEPAARVEFEAAHWHDEGLAAPTEFGPDFVEPDFQGVP